MGNNKIKDRRGCTFGRLTVLYEDVVGSVVGRRLWCLCECGNYKSILESNVVRREASCGCKQYGYWKRAKYILDDYEKYVKIRDILRLMIRRCNGKIELSVGYKEKGISVCDEWMNDPIAFYQWSVNNGYEHGLQIDRYPNNNGNYEPQNCRWVLPIINNRNRSNTKYITVDGNSILLTEWTKLKGINPFTIYGRLNRGWSMGDAINTPIGIRKEKKQTT